MGIAVSGFQYLAQLSKKVSFKGSILQLGRQDILMEIDTLFRVAKDNGVTLRDVPIETKVHRFANNMVGVQDTTFFRMLGFDEVYSMDVSDYEEPTHIANLNYPVPSQLENLFHFIYDGGTLEHVFHIPNALTNIHKMLKVGGYIVHALPMDGYPDHGFYQFSPTLLVDYYSENQYEIIDCYIAGLKGGGILGGLKTLIEQPLHVAYMPGILDKFCNGDFTKDNLGDLEIWGVCFCAKKTERSTCGVIPEQGRYRRIWSSFQLNKQK